MTDNINKPPHYLTHPSGVEAIVICEKLGFCLGNAFKYLFRCGYKGDSVEDLKKAVYYLERAQKQRAGLWFKWNGGYDPFLDGPEELERVLRAEKRYNGHMCVALANTYAAHARPRSLETLAAALNSVEKMIKLAECRKGA